MIGLTVIFISILWLIFAILISVIMMMWIKNIIYKFFFSLLLFLIIFPLPIIDEIVYKYQFEKLCGEKSTLWISDDAKGKTLYYAGSRYHNIDGLWMPVGRLQWEFKDVTTKKNILIFREFSTQGGILARTFFRGPIFFEGSCVSKYFGDENELFSKIGVKIIKY